MRCIDTCVDDPNVLGTTWALWRSCRSAASWSFFRDVASRNLAQDAAAVGFLLMLSQWDRCMHQELWLQLLMSGSDTLRLPASIVGSDPAGSLGGGLDPGFRMYLHRRYHKVVVLVEFVEVRVGAASPETVLAACEVFSTGSARQWLKVAGDGKAELIEDGLQRRADPTRTVIAELGSFVGYSAVRMAWRTFCASIVLSLESDAVHVAVARHLADLAGVSIAVNVWAGPAQDSQRRFTDEFGAFSVGFIFMDHRGTRFHEDLAALQQLHGPPPSLVFLADNVLKPGAPECLWQVEHSSTRNLCTQISWSMPEFVQESSEDWMLSLDFLPLLSCMS